MARSAARFPFPRHDTFVLILDNRFVPIQLAEQHDNRLQDVDGLESCHDDGLLFILRDPFVGAASDDR